MGAHPWALAQSVDAAEARWAWRRSGPNGRRARSTGTSELLCSFLKKEQQQVEAGARRRGAMQRRQGCARGSPGRRQRAADLALGATRWLGEGRGQRGRGCLASLDAEEADRGGETQGAFS